MAVIGASNNMIKWGFNILNVLLTKGGRQVYAVNKNEPEVQGLTAYATVADVPGLVEVAVITVPYLDVPAAIEDCVRKGVKVAVIISGGLAETGGEGASIEKQAAEIARRGGVRLVGPNCMGHFDTSTNIFTVPYLPPPLKGCVGFVTQSGNASQSVVAQASDVGLGFSKYVSSGNEADLHLEDYIEYLAQDDNTRVIIGYVEGIRNGRRFLEVARETTKSKPIVVVKAGRTEGGARAARSHTASLAGSDLICDAAFRQCGVIRVDETGELVDVAQVLLGQPLPRGRRVGVLSTGGGAAVMAADALMRHGLELPALAPTTMERLNSMLPRRWSHNNPVENGGEPFDYESLWTLQEDENIDATLVIGAAAADMNYASWVPLPPSLASAVDEWMDASADREISGVDKARELMEKYQRPLVTANMGLPMAKKGRVWKKLAQHHLVPYLTVERAASALGHLVEYSEYLAVAKGSSQ